MKNVFYAIIITFALCILTACMDSEEAINVKPVNGKEMTEKSANKNLTPEEAKIQDLLGVYAKAYATKDYGTLFDVITEQLDEDITRDEFVVEFGKENGWIMKNAEYKLNFIKMLEPYTDDDGQTYSVALVDVIQKGALDDSLPESFTGKGEAYLLEASNEYGYLVSSIGYLNQKEPNIEEVDINTLDTSRYDIDYEYGD